MKKVLLFLYCIFCLQTANATIHVIQVWDGYFQFLPAQTVIELGDTVQWLPLDQPTIVHTVTSTNIPQGATAFDQIWQAPADTFFQYIPTELGLYEYECTPHAVSFNMIGSIIVYPATGIGENGGIPPVYVSPNPASEYIQIFNKPDRISYRILDIKGRVVSDELYDNTYDVSQLNEGYYFVELLFERPRIIRFIRE